jgi:hypothetical protein
MRWGTERMPQKPVSADVQALSHVFWWHVSPDIPWQGHEQTNTTGKKRFICFKFQPTHAASMRAAQ